MQLVGTHRPVIAETSTRKNKGSDGDGVESVKEAGERRSLWQKLQRWMDREMTMAWSCGSECRRRITLMGDVGDEMI